jgi:hypothetical protein
MSIASHSDSDMFLIQIVVMVKGWSVSGPLLILLKTQKPLPGYAVSDSKRIPQAALLHGKMSEMDLSGSCYYIRHRKSIHDRLC